MNTKKSDDNRNMANEESFNKLYMTSETETPEVPHGDVRALQRYN